MILLHGWPGSVREFYDIIPLLTTPSKDNIAFEVIAPSLPGYGWSEGASKQGLGAVKIAIIMQNLMERLGLKKYYVQGNYFILLNINLIKNTCSVIDSANKFNFIHTRGGDWGSYIGSNIATLFPENVLGMRKIFFVVN
jgi:juvenile hormone epoxide hydrolase